MRFGPQRGQPVEEGLDLRRYNELQLQEIERHKWIESEKAGRDLGEEAAMDWIHRYAAAFREAHGLAPSMQGAGSWIRSLKERLVTTMPWA